MKPLYKPSELVEKIVLETRIGVWVALSVGGCGILTRAKIRKHDEGYLESRSVALAFAYHVIHEIGLSVTHDSVLTSQILVDVADKVINDPDFVALLCTTWRYTPEGVEICSVGSNSVLVFEGDTIQEVITPHTVNASLQSQGSKVRDPLKGGRMVTHTLGSKKNSQSCSMNDVRVALIPLLPTTTIAIIEDRRLADALLQHRVPGNELSSFVEMWKPLGTRIRTSVILSL